MQGSVLIVDDQESIRQSLAGAIEEDGHTVIEAADGEEAVRLFEKSDPDVVLLDLGLPGLPGMEVLERIRSIRSDARVVIVTAEKEVRFAVEAMKKGAFDYIPKPVNLDYLSLVIRRILEIEKTSRELQHLRRAQKKEYGVDFIISDKSKMKQVLDVVKQVAESDSTSVLIEGESGTGKELVANILHHLSRRSARPFLDINCASLPEELLESELFGHEKGAYTDAHAQKKGLLELADGGTLFLDEVGEMSLTIQVKLLRVLEKMVFRRVGGVKDIRVSVRIVSATNRDLREEVRAGRFREDLYYRLKVVPLRLPPLRERPEDIPLLATHFLGIFNGQFGKEYAGFTPEAMDLMLRYPWPGNIREMRNLLERAALLGKGETIGVRDLALSPDESVRDGSLLEGLQEALAGRMPADGIPLEEILAGIEREIILQASERTSWNQSQTSRLLRMNRDKLRYRMKQYDLTPEEAPSASDRF